MRGPRRPSLFVVGGDEEVAWPFASVLSLADSFDEAEVGMFTGGSDVGPALYGEDNRRRLSSVDPRRDQVDVHYFHELRSRKLPLIGICRGAQFLTAMLGGKLYQDVTGHGINPPAGHKIITSGGILYEITSTHHQMMRPRGTYELLAWSEHRSHHYLTGEGPVIPDLDVDPEIVWYPEAKALCIQGHPEYMDGDAPVIEYCCDLVRKLILPHVE